MRNILQIYYRPQTKCLVTAEGLPGPGGAWSQGVPGLGGLGLGVPGGDLPWTATAAGGTHPTGMHSCFEDIFAVCKIKAGSSCCL